jgi:probable rRNA maturation factor
MVKTEFTNKTRKYMVDGRKLSMLVNKIAQLSGVNEGTVSISFVGKKRIRNINKKFRNIDKATNVISFPFMEHAGNEFLIGDIVICPAVAKEQAKRQGNDFCDYMTFLIIHGFLHLLGYDHIKESDRVIMEKKEEEIFGKIKLPCFLKEVELNR